jgi:hypothetical protein
VGKLADVVLFGRDDAAMSNTTLLAGNDELTAVGIQKISVQRVGYDRSRRAAFAVRERPNDQNQCCSVKPKNIRNVSHENSVEKL